MAALAYRAAFWPVLILLGLSAELCTARRYGLPAKYITVAREKRSEPSIIEASEIENLVNNGHSRVRRAADVRVHAPNATLVHTNDSHQQVMIQWAGEGSDVIVCVTRDAQQTASSVSHVFISADYGGSYANHTQQFKTAEGKPAIINKFYKNDKFTSRFVFTDVIHKYIYVTQDYGETIISHKVEFAPTEVSHHPLDASVLLAHDTEDPIRKLWVSENFGETWRVIGLYVKSYFWSEYTSPVTLYVERGEPDQSSMVLSSQFLFRDGLTPVIVTREVEEFEVQDEFLFAVRKSVRDQSLYLTVAYQGDHFITAQFPNELKHENYYIADISEGQVMVCVAHEHFWSNLYVSSVPRSAHHPVQFSLSLERILFYKPSSIWDSTWISGVSQKKFADLHPVEGVRGVFIASVLQEDMTNTTSSLRPEHLTSYISFDQGAQWKPLQPPRIDADGEPISCERANNCSLHVSQEFSHLYPSTDTTPILSRKSAPGLILATGTIGSSLKEHTSLYISTDAGINWKQVLKGDYLYTFGDHGGVMLAVQPYSSEGEVNELLYSTDEGLTWNAYQFFDQKMRVYGLMTEPGENTTIFTIFGSMPSKHQWIFVKVNMSSVFLYKCTKDDYKTWSPSDGRSGRLCLLGRKQTYERRIPHSNCFNGLDYDRPISVENCPCDREDFECDFGFKIGKDSPKCVLDGAIDPYAIPTTCRPGGFYNRTKGYRLIPGDTCEAGRGYQYTPSITACPVLEDQEFLLVSARQEILRYDLVNPENGLQPLPIPNLKMVIALDFDLTANCIYWSDVDEKKIFRLCFDGKHDVEVLVERDLQSVEGLAYDWISHNLYFVDGERKTLEVIRADISNFGRMRRTLLSSNLDNPRGIALHPVRGYLYITDWSESSPKVARAFLDGTNFTVLFGVGVVGWPNGITIDFHTEKIFFADAKLDYIASADLDGRNMRKIISNNDKVMQPFAVGIYKSTLFWDDWTVYKVLQADKEFGWGITPIGNFTRKGLVDLKVFGHWSQQGNNSCGHSLNHTHSNNCPYLCMARPNNQSTCLCPNGLQKKAGTPPGQPIVCLCPDDSVVNTDGSCGSGNTTCSPKYFRCASGRCIPEQWLCDADNDCGDMSDESPGRCGQEACESPGFQCNNSRCILPSQQCDHHDDCGDGSDEYNCGVYQPCPNTTFQCANKRCINKSWLCDMEDDCYDGSDEVNCTTTTIAPKRCRASEFTCKTDNRCLPGAWRCDGEKDCNDQSDEEECVKYSCEAWQFQCKTTKQCIFKSWECDGEPDCVDKTDEANCTRSTTAHPPTTPTLFPPGPPQQNCSELMFRCDNGHCVPFWWRCDRLDDCGDWSDEDGCSYPGHRNHNSTTAAPPTVPPVPHTCQKDQFQCRFGSCIWETWVCDQDQDCPEGEDEANCHQTFSCDNHTEFRCRRSGGCFPRDMKCNGHPDCADGSDEEGCEFTPPPTKTCPADFFMCDWGSCQRLYKRCDGNQDCIDSYDEHNCSSSVPTRYTVMNFEMVRNGNTSAEIKWKVKNETTAPSLPGLQYLPSVVQMAKIGNPGAWKNYSWTTDKSYKLVDLQPYTNYQLNVYVREKNGSTIYPATEHMMFRTEEGVPDPPEDVKVEQQLDKVRITWNPPYHPNGLIRWYHIHRTPPYPPSEDKLPANVQEVLVSLQQFPKNLTVWVTAATESFVSAPSEKVNFTKAPVDSPLNVNSEGSTATSVSLSWQAVPGVDGYTLTYDRPENDFMGRVTVNTTEPKINVTGLAPHLQYTFEVRAYKGRLKGPPNNYPATTPGDALVPVQELKAALTSSHSTTIKLSWIKPAYKGQKKVVWEYRVVWGQTLSEMKQGVHSMTTTNTTITIPGLEACQSYILAVMVSAPLGTGPLNKQQVLTGPDPLAPPKNLKVQMENTTLKITWEASCPLALNSSIDYLIRIYDTVQQQTSIVQLLGQGNRTFSHTMKGHWGAKYEVTMSSALHGARFTDPPVYISGPVIPPPYELTYHPDDSSFYWRNNQSLPHHILQQNYSYVLTISKYQNLSSPMTLECDQPPLKVPELSLGFIYFAVVALKDQDGYLSPPSQYLRFERPIGDKVVVSQSSVVGVAVSMFLVVVALVAVVAVLAVRHRRLARSFLTFANTHYDRSQGTTLITTNDHSLDEDDDSPMIRGFSDDEPLVIA